MSIRPISLTFYPIASCVLALLSTYPHRVLIDPNRFFCHYSVSIYRAPILSIITVDADNPNNFLCQ